MTAATLRQQARDAEARCDWAAAARLYEAAVAAYPPFAGSQSLAARDVANLKAKASECALAASVAVIA